MAGFDSTILVGGLGGGRRLAAMVEDIRVFAKGKPIKTSESRLQFIKIAQ
jgi:hypothetical protein